MLPAVSLAVSECASLLALCLPEACFRVQESPRKKRACGVRPQDRSGPSGGLTPHTLFFLQGGSKLPHSKACGVLVLKVLEPLCWFGLLERDTPEDDWRGPFSERKFRKTALFDQFIHFVGPP
jgi:hypothetical protein